MWCIVIYKGLRWQYTKMIEFYKNNSNISRKYILITLEIYKNVSYITWYKKKKTPEKIHPDY